LGGRPEGTGDREEQGKIEPEIIASPRGLKFARYYAGQFKPDEEASLRSQGVDILTIRNPSREDVERFTEEQGWYLKPRWVRWIRPAQSAEEFLAGLDDGKLRGQYKKILRESANVKAEIKPLTLEDYAEFFPIYRDEVGGKPGGRLHLTEGWAEQELKGVRKWHGIYFRDPDTNEMTGGMLVAEVPEGGYLSMGYAAYRPKAKEYSISYRGALMAMDLAVKLGYKLVSEGADTNLYGYDYSLGLLGFKAKGRMYPFAEGPIELLKALDPSKFLSITDSKGQRPGYFFFSLKREGTFYERLLEALPFDDEDREVRSLWGGGFFAEGTPKPEEMMAGNHFYGDDMPILAPRLVELRRFSAQEIARRGLAPEATREGPPAAASIPAFAAMTKGEVPANESSLPAPKTAKKAARFFIAGAVLKQAGFEIVGTALPLIMSNSLGDFALAAIFYRVGSFITNMFFSGPIMQRAGLRTTNLTGVVLGIAAMCLLAGAFIFTGSVTLPLLIGAMTLHGIGMALFVASEENLSRELYGDDRDKIQHFDSRLQLLTEIAGILTPFVAAYLKQSMGGQALGFTPLFYGLAFTLFFVGLRGLERSSRGSGFNKPGQARSPPPHTPAKATMSKLAEGFLVVVTTPRLRTAVAGMASILIFNNFLYNIIAPGFASSVLHWQPAGAWITGLYSAGGMLGAYVLGLAVSSMDNGRGKRIKSLLHKATDRQWLFALAVSTVIFTAALASAQGLVLIAPITFIWGLLWVVGYIKVRSIVKSEAPEESRNSVISFMAGFGTLTALAGLWGVRQILPGALGENPTPAQQLAYDQSMFQTIRIMAAASIIPILYWFYLALRLFGKKAPAQIVHHSAEGEQAKAMAKLQKSLETLGLPVYRTEKISEVSDPLRPAVAMLALPSVYKISILREVCRQSPRDGYLALDPSWIIQEVDHRGRSRWLIKKGLTFDEAGAPVIVEFEHPRPSHYDMQFLTMGAYDRDDGAPLEKGLDTPMSSSSRLEAFINDKLLTRILLAAQADKVPTTLAFTQGGSSKFQVPSSESKVQVVAGFEETQVRKSVARFLENYQENEVVVKPSGPQWHSGKGVKFFDKSEGDGIVAHVLELAGKVAPDEEILVEQRIVPLALIRDGRKMESVIRVLVNRAPWDKGVATGKKKFFRIGPPGLPTTAEPLTGDKRDAATAEEFYAVCREMGLMPEQIKDVEARLEDTGAKAFAAIAAYEKSLPRAPGQARQDQTDMIGLDVMLQLENGRIEPYVIEVNDHDSGGQAQLDQFYPDDKGSHSLEWAATMLARARRDVLRGKRIVVVGAGYPSKRPIFEKAREMGVKVVLIDLPGSWAKDLVSEYIPIDTTRRDEALAQVMRKLQRSVRRRGPLDGIRSFWEDDLVLTARLAKELNLPYHSIAAITAARSKFETRKKLAEAGLPFPIFHIIRNQQDLERALGYVSYPAVLKPAHGAASIGVKKVNSQDEARQAYRELVPIVNTGTDGTFYDGTELVLESYLEGQEVDVDLVIQNGQAVFSSVTDNWPTKEPYFLATGSSLPSKLTMQEQQRLIDLAARASRALGLSEGVLHVEAKMTPSGPQIIEVNARMGGSYVRKWVEAVWGVDLVEMEFLIAAGIPAYPFKAEAPRVYLEGEFINAETSGQMGKIEGMEQVRATPGYFAADVLKKSGERIAAPPKGYDNRLAMITAQAETSQAAQGNLERMMAKVRWEVIGKASGAPSSSHNASLGTRPSRGGLALVEVMLIISAVGLAAAVGFVGIVISFSLAAGLAIFGGALTYSNRQMIWNFFRSNQAKSAALGFLRFGIVGTFSLGLLYSLFGGDLIHFALLVPVYLSIDRGMRYVKGKWLSSKTIFRKKLKKAWTPAVTAIFIILMASFPLQAMFVAAFNPPVQVHVAPPNYMIENFFSWSAFLNFIWACAIAPVFEEIVFRAGLQRAIESRFGWLPKKLSFLGFLPALVLSNVIFAFLHDSFWPQKFIMGMTFGIVFKKYGLTASMLTHFLWNFGSFFMFVGLAALIFSWPGASLAYWPLALMGIVLGMGILGGGGAQAPPRGPGIKPHDDKAPPGGEAAKGDQEAPAPQAGVTHLFAELLSAKPKHKAIFEGRFLARPPLTQAALAVQLGITSGRVSQIEKWLREKFAQWPGGFLLSAPAGTRKRRGDQAEKRSEGATPDPLRRTVTRGHLPPEEQRALAVRMIAGDRQARNELIETNQAWIVTRAIFYCKRYQIPQELWPELIQEVNIVLMEKMSKKYDPDRGAFTTYAEQWIWSIVGRWWKNHRRNVRVPVGQQDGGYRVAPDVSLDQPIGGDEDGRRVGEFFEGGQTPEDELHQARLEQLFAKFAETLNERERTIFQERMVSDEPKTLEDLAGPLNITRERVRQIEFKIRENLKKFLKPKRSRLGAILPFLPIAFAFFSLAWPQAAWAAGAAQV
ncbi:MAG: ATP-grasp domain-containing protein, partial [Elusimicrobia bacterium]|nr:ATP-grasp domain-containing protein [Elusimicrobiota bacterium]